MARKIEWSGDEETVPASTSFSFGSKTLPTPTPDFNLVALILEMGTATLADIDRIRVKNKSGVYWDVARVHFRSLCSRYFPNHVAPATTDKIIYIPLNNIHAEAFDEDVADECGAKIGENPVLELQMGAGGAGVARVGYVLSNIRATRYSAFTSGTPKWVLSKPEQADPLAEDGIIKGLSMSMTGIDRLDITMSRTNRFSSNGAQPKFIASPHNPLSGVVDPLMLDFAGPFLKSGQSAGGNDKISVSTGAAYVSSEIGKYAFRPQ